MLPVYLVPGSYAALMRLWLKPQTIESIKMSCFFCKEHIEFPSHATGQKIPCPHCAKTITLLNPVFKPE
jgi:hypothetical protein